MSKIILSIAFTLFAVLSCKPPATLINGSKTRSNVSSNKEIYVFSENEYLPDSVSFLGEIETKGHFFTSEKFRVNESIELIKDGAAQLNGNAIQIEEIRFPGMFSSKSYDIKAKVLGIEKFPAHNFKIVSETSKQGCKYIKLYRPNKIFGSGICYPVYINGFFLGGLDNNSKITIELENYIEDYYLQIESYGKLYKVPLLFRNGSVVYTECAVGSDGSPIVTFPEI